MIYTASYFHPENYHGERIAISLGVPKGVQVDSHLDMFKPTSQLLKLWQVDPSQTNWPHYEHQFRLLLAERQEQIFAWLDSLSPYRPLPHMTLLCWERDDQFCHRRLVMERVIQKYKPQLAGGRDVPQIQVGDEIDWVGMPNYLDWLRPLQVKAVEQDTVWCNWIGVPILKSEIRRLP